MTSKEVTRSGNVEIPFNLKSVYKDSGGHPHVIMANASNTRKDGDGEYVSDNGLAKMAEIIKTGKQPDGRDIAVTFIEGHHGTFELGWPKDASTRKEADGNTALDVDILLNEANPLADVLYKEVELGNCKKGGSFHGIFNTVLKKDASGNLSVVYDEPQYLEHLALTRPGRAAVRDSKFIAAMTKELDEPGGNDMTNEELTASVQEMSKTLKTLQSALVPDETSKQLTAKDTKIAELTKTIDELKAQTTLHTPSATPDELLKMAQMQTMIKTMRGDGKNISSADQALIEQMEASIEGMQPKATLEKTITVIASGQAELTKTVATVVETVGGMLKFLQQSPGRPQPALLPPGAHILKKEANGTQGSEEDPSDDEKKLRAKLAEFTKEKDMLLMKRQSNTITATEDADLKTRVLNGILDTKNGLMAIGINVDMEG